MAIAVRYVIVLFVIIAMLGLFVTLRQTANKQAWHREFNLSSPVFGGPPPSQEPHNEGFDLPPDAELSTPHPVARNGGGGGVIQLHREPLSFPAQFVFRATSPPLDARSAIIAEPEPLESSARAAFRSRIAASVPSPATAVPAVPTDSAAGSSDSASNEAAAAAVAVETAMRVNSRAAAVERRLIVRSLRRNPYSAYRMSDCGQKMSEGLYWQYSSQKCVPIEGFRAPLRSYEVGIDELSCSAPEARKRWLVTPFEKMNNASDVATTVDLLGLEPGYMGADFFASKNSVDAASSSPDAAAAAGATMRERVKGQYSRYIFYSSWLFRQFRPWRPLPVSTEHILRQPALPQQAAQIYDVLRAGTTGAPQGPPPPTAAPTPVPDVGDTAATTPAAPPTPVPPPVAVPAGPAVDPLTRVQYRSLVDPNIEKLMRVENFCVSPIAGYMSGYGPEAKFHGRSWMNDDTRGAHNEPQYRDFLNKVRNRKTPPAFFDRRPVIFFSSMFLSSHNMAHSHFKFWSLLGVLKLGIFDAERLAGVPPPRRSRDNQPDPAGPPVAPDEDAATNETSLFALPQQLKPLIMFVLRYDDKERHRARAFGFMYMMLDLPWAVQLTDPHDDGPMDDMFKRARHGNPGRGTGWVAKKVASTQKSTTVKTCRNETTKGAGGEATVKEVCEEKTHVALNEDPSEPDEMCFLRGVAWGNCHHNDCVINIDGDKPESFNFYNYQPINSWRRWMFSRYEALLARCVPVKQQQVDALHPDVVAPVQAPSKAFGASRALLDLHGAPPAAPVLRRPKLLFNIRTSSRAVWFQNLFMDWLRTELVQEGFASDVIFRELWKGSRAQYLDDVRTSDIFAGVHGGSFAVTMLLRPRPVVVEYAGSWSFCQPHQGPAGPYCWFDAQSQFKDGSHWVYEFPFSMWDGVFRLGSFAIIDSMKEASCRWFAQNYDGIGVKDASKRAVENLIRVRNGTTNERAPLFSGSTTPPPDPSAPASWSSPSPSSTLTPRQREELEHQLPAYCRDATQVKYSDMKRLHVALGDRTAIDAREVQYLLQRFFSVEVTVDTANRLLRHLNLAGGQLHWYMESHAFDLFQMLFSHFIDARLIVHNRTARIADRGGRPMVVRHTPHGGFRYPLQRLVCLRAVSPFFFPGVAVRASAKNASVFEQQPPRAASASARTSGNRTRPRVVPPPPVAVLTTFVPNDFDPDTDDTADTLCLFVARVHHHAPGPGAPTLVAPDAPTTTPAARPTTVAASVGQDDAASSASPLPLSSRESNGSGSGSGKKRRSRRQTEELRRQEEERRRNGHRAKQFIVYFAAGIFVMGLAICIGVKVREEFCDDPTPRSAPVRRRKNNINSSSDPQERTELVVKVGSGAAAAAAAAAPKRGDSAATSAV